MNSESKGFERLIKKLEELEATHKKRSRQEMFILFDTVINSMILEFITLTDIKMSVERTEKGITVTLTEEDNFLLSCDEDRKLLKILNLANTAFIKKNGDSISLEI